jgi:hypothetical protein
MSDSFKKSGSHKTPSNRADLTRCPNSTEQVQQFGNLQVDPPEEWNLLTDKAVLMPDHSFGQRPAKGDVLIFRPLQPGKPVLPTKRPILVRLPDGGYAVTAYNALQISRNKLEVVAICRHWHPPIDDQCTGEIRQPVTV